MRILYLVGLSWNIAQMRLENKPWTEWFWTDNGRLSGDQNDPSQWHNFYFEAGMLARVHGLAPVLRSAEKNITVLHQVMKTFAFPQYWQYAPPTASPFFDTGALGDVVSTPSHRAVFDCRNPEHLEKLWTVVFRPFFQLFDDSHPNVMRERTPNGRPLITWWGLRNTFDAMLGNEVQNWEDAQRMLDHVSKRMIEEGFGEPDHVVDWSWPATIKSYGMHAWFSAPTSSWSTHTHNGVTVGVVVAGFRDPAKGDRRIHRKDGETYEEGLAACKAANCDLVYVESLTNIPESTGPYRCEPNLVNRETNEKISWDPNTLYLDITAKYAQNEPVPQPKPKPDPKPEGPMITVSETPLAKMVALPTVPGKYPGTYAIRWNKATNKPDPTAVNAAGEPTYFSIREDGSFDVRTTIDRWESGKPEGDKIWFRADEHAAAVFGFRDLGGPV